MSQSFSGSRSVAFGYAITARAGKAFGLELKPSGQPIGGATMASTQDAPVLLDVSNPFVPGHGRLRAHPMNALDQIASMLAQCGHPDGIMPATALFNKKWLLRLLLDRLASPPHPAHPLSPAGGARWFTDALLATRFIGDGRGDKRAESYTRADGAIGHFRLGSGGHGDLSLGPKATQFVVIAAKLEGALSSGARNAPYFDQAARSVACMAHLLEKSNFRPEALDTLAYHVVAPADRISRGIFDKQLDKNSIRDKVLHRAEVFGSAHRVWIAGWFEPVLERMTLSALSWEDLIGKVRTADRASGLVLKKFYDQCLAYNLPR